MMEEKERGKEAEELNQKWKEEREPKKLERGQEKERKW